MARVLLLPASAADVLAHLGTSIAIGTELARRGHDARIGYAGHFEEAARASGLPLEPARATERPRGRKSLGRLFSSAADLVDAARADARTIEQVAPDAVVVDSRPTGWLGCAILGIAHVSLVHSLVGYPWYREPSPWKRRLRWLTRPQRTPVYLRARLDPDPAGVRRLTGQYFEARSLLGLPPATTLIGGDALACVTTPLLDPTFGMPPTWHYVGPITWSATTSQTVPMRGRRPLVYVTQGSTGSAEGLETAVRELAGENVDVVATTAGLCEPTALESLAPNVRAARLLPGDEVLAQADVVVAHGGNLTMLATHRAGKPVVVLPYDYDQWQWADRVERLGTGIALRPPRFPGAIRRAVARVLRRDRYRLAAAELAAHLREWDGPARTADLLEDVAGLRNRIADESSSQTFLAG